MVFRLLFCLLAGLSGPFHSFSVRVFEKKLSDMGPVSLFSLSSINPFSHEYNNSFLSSGFIVLVSSTILLKSLADVSLRFAFHLAFASNNCFSSFARAVLWQRIYSVETVGLRPGCSDLS